MNANKYTVKVIHNLKVALRNDDPGISQVLKRSLRGRTWHREPEFMDVLQDNLQPKERFLDLGCNIGYVSMFVLSQLDRDGVLYAIEPDPKNVEAFQKSISLNPDIKQSVYDVTQCAFSDHMGTGLFDLSSKSNLSRLRNVSSDFHQENTITVPVSTFDNYFSDKPFPTFMKMDVEGAELSVINGMKDFLRTDNPLKILLELHPGFYSENKTATRAAFDLLFTNGFRLDTFASGSIACPKPITDKGYRPYKTYKSGSWGRGLYRNVSPEDFYNFIDNKEPVKVRLSLKDAIFQRKRFKTTNKIARAALFIRN